MNNDANLIPADDLTDADIANLLAHSIPADEFAARLAAHLDEATEDFEVGDTVRFVGKTARWEIEGFNADGTVSVCHTKGGFGRGRTWSYISRDVTRDRIALVRKGNATQDAIDELDRRFPPKN